MDITSETAKEIDALKFAEIVSSKSDAELTQALGELQARSILLDTIFEQMEARLHAERARGMREVIHWRILGRPDGGDDAFQVLIEDGVARVSRELDREPRVTFEVDGVSFLRMIAGQTNGMKLALARKLKIKGDMMFAPRVEGLFRTEPAAT